MYKNTNLNLTSLEKLEEDNLIKKTISFVKDFFKGESSGHDFYHTMRVYRTAKQLAKIESKTKNVDITITLLASLLHDVDDFKVSPETNNEKSNAVKFLRENNISEENIKKIIKIIEDVSFVGKDSVTPSTLEGMIVKDADRLDALGAIGVGRAFAYGGKKGRAMYDPNVMPNLNMDETTYKNYDSTTINHFYEKLLLLEDLMNTSSGKEMARHRTEYTKNFLNEFLTEWNGEK